MTRDPDGAADIDQGLDDIVRAYLAEALAPHGVGIEALSPAALARMIADAEEWKSATCWVLIPVLCSRDDAPELCGRDLWRGQRGDAEAFAWAGPSRERLLAEARVLGPREVYLAVDGQYWIN